jgi:hypothetical protein
MYSGDRHSRKPQFRTEALSLMAGKKFAATRRPEAVSGWDFHNIIGLCTLSRYLVREFPGGEQGAKAAGSGMAEEFGSGCVRSHKVFPKAGAQLAIIDLCCNKSNLKMQMDREG